MPVLRNERARACHDLAFAEVIRYNKANLERVEQNEGRRQTVSRTKRRKKFNGNVIGKSTRLWYYVSETNRCLEETYMVDFIVGLFWEIVDFFITFWGDNVIDKFAKRNK